MAFDGDGCGWGGGLRLTVLVIAMMFLTGRLIAGFKAGGVAACPAVVEYSRKLQARAAEEPALLTKGSAVAKMIVDYTVLRE